MFFTGASYTGHTTSDEKRFDDIGTYVFPNGDRYIGGFCDGNFHGNGIIYYHSEDGAGGGQYRGVWRHGLNISGAYVYADGLVFGGDGDLKEKATVDYQGAASPAALAASWSYCRSSDRRLWAEHLLDLCPVLPHETVTTRPDDPRKEAWKKAPIILPEMPSEETLPPSLSGGGGLRKGGAAVANNVWDDPKTKEQLAQPTIPLAPADEAEEKALHAQRSAAPGNYRQYRTSPAAPSGVTKLIEMTPGKA